MQSDLTLNNTLSNNNEYEIMDMSTNGLIKATGEGVVSIVEILNNMNRNGTNRYNIINQVSNNNNRHFHMRDSPFGDMVTPLFETGERIHFLSQVVANQREKDNIMHVKEEDILLLESIDNPCDIDCSICLEDLKKGDIPEFK